MRLQAINQQITHPINNPKSKNISFGRIYRFLIPDASSIITIIPTHREESIVTRLNVIFEELYNTLKQYPNIFINGTKTDIHKFSDKVHIHLHENTSSQTPASINILTGEDVMNYLEVQNNPEKLNKLFKNVDLKNTFIVKNSFEAWDKLIDILPDSGINDDGRKIAPELIGENIPDWTKELAQIMKKYPQDTIQKSG